MLSNEYNDAHFTCPKLSTHGTAAALTWQKIQEAPASTRSLSGPDIVHREICVIKYSPYILKALQIPMADFISVPYFETL